MVGTLRASLLTHVVKIVAESPFGLVGAASKCIDPGALRDVK